MVSKGSVSIEDLSKGDIVQYEEKHYLACIVKIKEQVSPEEDDFLEYKAEIIDLIFGSMKIGTTFTFGANMADDKQQMRETYRTWTLKKPGEMTEYIRGGIDQDDINSYLDKLKEKYRND